MNSAAPISNTARKARAGFQNALEIAVPEARERFLVEHCEGDDELLARVRQLLAANEEAGTFLSEGTALSPEIEAELARLKPEAEGERIGRYKLLQEIGEGGFGTVWMAAQVEPVSRRVALKIIKMGMDTREVIGRFEQER
ncbi:MAG: serine/threonine protein kinase, partial [Chthoniobacteraceae bacterium]